MTPTQQDQHVDRKAYGCNLGTPRELRMSKARFSEVTVGTPGAGILPMEWGRAFSTNQSASKSNNSNSITYIENQRHKPTFGKPGKSAVGWDVVLLPYLLHPSEASLRPRV